MSSWTHVAGFVLGSHCAAVCQSVRTVTCPRRAHAHAARRSSMRSRTTSSSPNIVPTCRYPAPSASGSGGPAQLPLEVEADREPLADEVGPRRRVVAHLAWRRGASRTPRARGSSARTASRTAPTPTARRPGSRARPSARGSGTASSATTMRPNAGDHAVEEEARLPVLDVEREHDLARDVAAVEAEAPLSPRRRVVVTTLVGGSHG